MRTGSQFQRHHKQPIGGTAMMGGEKDCKAFVENQAKEQAKIDAKRTEHLQALQEQEKEQAERDQAHQDLKAKLLAWSGDDKSGTLKNIRTLLSTLENILREGGLDSACEKWEKVKPSMADLVQERSVKISYYRAVRLVPPDRSQTQSVRQQVVSTWVMHALNAAWKKQHP
mgnify:CR=1 FL=1